MAKLFILDFAFVIVAKKKTDNVKMQDDSKLFAFLAVLLSIIGFIIAYAAKRDNKYVMFYAKQSLIVFILSVIAGIISPGIVHIPVTGEAIKAALGIIVFLAWLISWIYALSGEKKELPYIGHYGNKIKL